MLLENGGAVGSVNDGGNSALHWAGYFGHYQVCTMLLTEGADPLLKNKKGNWTYLFFHLQFVYFFIFIPFYYLILI